MVDGENLYLVGAIEDCLLEEKVKRAESSTLGTLP